MADEDSGTSNQSSDDNGRKPVVVGIGASAGGVRALQDFFEALPDEPGAAFVVVVHLDPQSHSELPSILGARTKMPVVQVGATQEFQANHVYVIAPGRRLRITDRDISSADFDEPRGRRAPIDLFFRSLAEQHGDGFAVVLTGAGSDGAVGVKEVKEAGGIILVQEPAEAEYPSMPRAAIATGVVDFVLPLQELATGLAELIRNMDNAPLADIRTFDEEIVRRILAQVRGRTGHDFSQYKRSTILRRIARRMQVNKINGIEEYYNFMRENAEEAQALLGDLLISVTTFFRDKDVFDALKTRVIPQLFATKKEDDQLRVWVPGCATGEEAYTIAMLLLDEASRHDFHPSVQIFASDLDVRSLAFAREGQYPAAIEADLDEEQLRRYFMHEGETYRVRRELRDMIVFASHSVLKDPPFSHIDLISCRNLLIYLDRDVQAQVCGTFHYALNPGGYLLLGSSETADTPPGLFRTIDRKNRIYQTTVERGDKPRLLPRLTGGPIGIAGQPQQFLGEFGGGRLAISEAALHRQVLEAAAPPSILIDRMHRVVHLSDHAGRYLQPSGGVLSGDAVDLVRPELRLELRAALHRAFEHREPTLTLPIAVQFNGSPHRVHLQVKPAREDDERETRNVLVLFIEGGGIEQRPAGDLSQGSDESNQLREELNLTQARLRTTLEESEAANEELRAANEELQSINEEHRSTAEELETSKEELQSINEELLTVNNELKSKLETISRAHSDLQNLMEATDFGTLFLDSSLRIKRFTEPVTQLFRITSNDEGRPVTDFAHPLDYPDLGKDARAVLDKLTPVSREIGGENGQWFDIRMRPYRTVEDKIDGVVVTFVDITERRQVEEALRQSERHLSQQKRLVELSHDPIFIWDFDNGVIEWNRGCEELYGYSREEAAGQNKEQLLGSIGAGFTFADVKAKLIKNRSWSGELTQRTKSGELLTVESRLQLESFDGRRLVLDTARNITDRKLWEQRQELLLRELTHRVKNTMAVVQSIVHQTLRSGRRGPDFAASVDGRLLALASAHSLLADTEWRGADFAALTRHQLEPFLEGASDRWILKGEDVLLPPDIAVPFGLVLHELATNAAKYGSLASPKGKVELNWGLARRNQKRTLIVTWREKDGPPVQPPATAGFGSALIENAIPDSHVTRDFRPEGLVCTIELALPGNEHGEHTGQS